MKTQSNIQIEMSTAFIISEQEMAALDALVGYGDDAFIKAFYEKLGEAYMKKHEQGLRTFFATVRKHVVPAIAKADRIRKIINEHLE